MTDQGLSGDERQRAYHEAGHAVLGVCLGVGCAGTALVGTGGLATFIADCTSDAKDPYPARQAAKNKTCFRIAIALYAGAEAARRAGYKNWWAGTERDYPDAEACIKRMTDDAEPIGDRQKLAQERAVAAVEYHWPEIEVLAQALLKSERLPKKLFEDEVTHIVTNSLTSRKAAPFLLLMEETKP